MMQSVTLNVLGMSCGHCVQSIEGALGKLAGVESAKVDLSAGQVSVTFDDAAVSVEKIKETIEDQGYDVA